MTGHLKVNTDWMNSVSSELLKLSQDLSDVMRRLDSVDDSDSSLRNAKISVYNSRGQRLTSVPDAIASFRREIAAVSDAVKQVSDAAGRNALLFENAERRIGQMIDRITNSPQSSASTADTHFGLNISDALKDLLHRLEQLRQKRDAYEQTLEDRRQHAVDDETRRLYEKYYEKINVSDSSYSGNAYHDSSSNEIKYDWQKDAENVRGPGYTYYHEVGHAIDDYSTLFGDASSSKAFTKSLQSDFDAYVNKIMSENNCTREEAYQHISDWLWEDSNHKNGISDIIGGLTGNQCVGGWGHSDTYWTGNEHGIAEAINNEAFAHFFEAGMCTTTVKLDYIKEIFPNAYEEFKKIVRKKL